MKKNSIVQFLLAIFIFSGVAHAETGAKAESVGQIQTSASTKAPTWKVSENSLLYDLSGTQAANRDAYSFGHVRILSEMIALEKTLSPEWKLFLRTQYISNYYELVAAG